mgnify:CR=1 FL=1
MCIRDRITRSGKNGAPYYTINYDEGGSTEGVTSGKIGKTIRIFCNTRLEIEKPWSILLESIKEIELILGTNYLDIEFGITRNWEVVVFQVRPLTTVKLHNIKKLENKIGSRILVCQKQAAGLTKKSRTNNQTQIFSDMTDWNPAEIIGNNPNELDYSLYNFLIMKDSWYRGRTILGYQKFYPHSLMVKFGNKPYVDVRVSFNSLIPDSFGPKLTQKLMNFYLEKLAKNPQLHDKTEFEILFTSQ